MHLTGQVWLKPVHDSFLVSIQRRVLTKLLMRHPLNHYLHRIDGQSIPCTGELHPSNVESTNDWQECMPLLVHMCTCTRLSSFHVATDAYLPENNANCINVSFEREILALHLHSCSRKRRNESTSVANSLRARAVPTHEGVLGGHTEKFGMPSFTNLLGGHPGRRARNSGCSDTVLHHPPGTAEIADFCTAVGH